MKKHILWAMFIALLPSLSWAASIGPSKILGPDQILRGRFKQIHQLRLPNKPLFSEGHFVVAPKLGVIFAFEKPLPLTLIITQTGMTQTIGGMPILVQTPKQAPIIGRLQNLLSAALYGNWRLFEQDFTLTRDGTGSNWRVYLVPKGLNGGSNLFKAVSASGSQFIDQAEILRPDNLYDYFTFFDQTVGSDQLTGEELAEFRKTLPKLPK